MARPVKSQWEFGDLFAPENTRRVLSVADLTGQVKRLLEAQFGRLWVSGEVSNLRVQSSGHAYFTLKDAAAQLACVLFRGAGRGLRDLLEDGRKVLLQGELTVYEPRGAYQLVVQAVELQGVGALQLAFERLKQKLQAEGLFAATRKRPLPPLPERIGIVTSPTGAALRDVLHVIARRHPALELVLAPCRVQGDGAAAEIATAIRRLNQYHAATTITPPDPGPGRTAAGRSENSGPAGLDLILVTRGGGSLEDLWAFNEEIVARAIAESALPVISAIGHEIDFTISDYVADLRAATPSAAAELVTQGAVAAREFVAEARARLPRLARASHEAWRQELRGLLDRAARAHPRRRVNEAWQHLDDLRTSLGRAARFGWREAATRWEALRGAWLRRHPSPQVAAHRETVGRTRARLLELGRRRLAEDRRRLEALRDQLRLLSPQQTLARGYSITRDARTGKVLRDPGQAPPGTVLNTRVAGGELHSVVTADEPRADR